MIYSRMDTRVNLASYAKFQSAGKFANSRPRPEVRSSEPDLDRLLSWAEPGRTDGGARGDLYGVRCDRANRRPGLPAVPASKMVHSQEGRALPGRAGDPARGNKTDGNGR